MTEEQLNKLESWLNDLSTTELNRTLETQHNFRNWLYREHTSFYLQIKDVLDEVWEYSKKVAKGVLDIAVGAAAVAVCVAAAPVYILGKLFGVIPD